jgi:phosphonate transport system substrate-binding protein
MALQLRGKRLALGWVVGILTLFGLTGCDSSKGTASLANEEAGAEIEPPVLQLTFGVYTSDAATEMVMKFAPVLQVLDAMLSERLSEPVRTTLRVASTYEGGVDDLVEGRVDFARMGPASYVMAKELNPGIRILAIESKKGSKIFQGVICVHADGDINEIADLKGERFAFGDSRSTIGRFLAQELLIENGIRAADLAGFDYLGRHDKVGMAVGRKKYAAGALKEGTFKKLVAAGEPIRAIASFPNVTKPWIARAGMEPRLFEAIHQTLLALEDDGALKALKKDGFLSGDDSDYDSIREAIEASRSFGS